MRGNGPANVIRIDQPRAIDRHIRHAKAVFLKGFAAIQHGLVLGGGGDDMVALVTISPGNPFQGQVIRFRSSTREDNLFGLGPNEGGNLLAGRMHRLFSFPAIAVRAARRIAKFVGEVRHHRLENGWINGRRGLVVEVNRSVHPAPLSWSSERECATSSAISCTRMRSSTPFALIPSSNICIQNGQPVATTAAPVSIACSVRMWLTRRPIFTSMNACPPPAPQHRPLR